MYPKTEKDANNFGMLRLLFAVLVAFAHSFCFVDGSSHREPLFNAFHNLTSGELAVDCFFLISGYLVAQSLLQSKSMPSTWASGFSESILAL
jgi:peptidoglycan/LPS O-acetylase OafA/YrhL